MCVCVLSVFSLYKYWTPSRAYIVRLLNISYLNILVQESILLYQQPSYLSSDSACIPCVRRPHQSRRRVALLQYHHLKCCRFHRFVQNEWFAFPDLEFAEDLQATLTPRTAYLSTTEKPVIKDNLSQFQKIGL